MYACLHGKQRKFHDYGHKAQANNLKKDLTHEQCRNMYTIQLSKLHQWKLIWSSHISTFGENVNVYFNNIHIYMDFLCTAIRTFYSVTQPFSVNHDFSNHHLFASLKKVVLVTSSYTIVKKKSYEYKFSIHSKVK